MGRMNILRRCLSVFERPQPLNFHVERVRDVFQLADTFDGPVSVALWVDVWTASRGPRATFWNVRTIIESRPE